MTIRRKRAVISVKVEVLSARAARCFDFNSDIFESTTFENGVVHRRSECVFVVEGSVREQAPVELTFNFSFISFVVGIAFYGGGSSVL